jgi:uncharacterized protein YukE
MGRKKKNSKTIDAAKVRIAAIRSIDPNFDLGNGKTSAAYQGAIDDAQKQLDNYNTMLSQVDEAYNYHLASEKKLRDVNEAMLLGVADKYGKDSNEYEKAGGKRKSERKKPVRKPKK